MIRRQLQAGAVAAGQQGTVLPGHAAGNDGPHGVQHKAAGQVEGGRDLRLPGGFLAALSAHQFRAGLPQLNAGKGVDGVVDAAVVRAVAAGHAAVGGVHDGVAPQGGDVALPQVQPRLNGGKGCGIGDALLRSPLLQVGVLHLQKVFPAGLRRTHIQQPAQQLPLAVGVGRDADVPVGRVFL